jgi:hypothetical protein
MQAVTTIGLRIAAAVQGRRLVAVRNANLIRG